MIGLYMARTDIALRTASDISSARKSITGDGSGERGARKAIKTHSHTRLTLNKNHAIKPVLTTEIEEQLNVYRRICPSMAYRPF